MTEATDAQRNFAASTINYFNIDLNGGAGDTIKALVEATKVTDVNGIVAAIKGAKETTQEMKNTAVTKAATALATVTTADTGAKDKATKAADALKTATTDNTNAETAAKTAADALAKATTDNTNAETAAKTAADALKTATDAKTAADGMKVGDDPVLEAAKAYNKACGDKIADIKNVDEDGVIACNTELLKGYGFINAILKNIPNKATDVLKSANPFAEYADNLTGDNLIAANKYALISSTVAGTGPFVINDEIPQPKNYTDHPEYVKNTLVQLNTISYALLQDSNCGTGTGTDITKCYGEHAKDLKAIYDVATIDKMNIDVSANYPYGQVSEGSELPTIDM